MSEYVLDSIQCTHSNQNSLFVLVPCLPEFLITSAYTVEYISIVYTSSTGMTTGSDYQSVSVF